MVLNDFIGTRLVKIGRCLNMCWITFISNDEKYALHIQSAWNITENSIVVLGDNDFYYPKNEQEDDNDFDWSVIGSALFDRKAEQLNYRLNSIDVKVKKVNLSLQNELIIDLDNNYRISTFTNTSNNSELWRAFVKGKSHHLVAYSNNILC